MGDRNFKWWLASGEDDECFSGPFASRDEAIDEGRGQYGDDETFYVCEADKTVMRCSIDAESHADRILEELCENNLECFGEDGPDDPWAHVTHAHRALGRAIEDAVSDWLAATPGKTWTFDTVRNGEYIEPKKEAA